MLCYAVNDYTKFIYPLKLHEYLASGRPVVGSPIESLHEFADVVRMAGGADEWSSALSDALQPSASSAGEIERRQRIAREHDWNSLVHVIARTLCSRLGSQYLEQCARVPFEQPPCAAARRPGRATTPEAARSLSELPRGEALEIPGNRGDVPNVSPIATPVERIPAGQSPACPTIINSITKSPRSSIRTSSTSKCCRRGTTSGVALRSSRRSQSLIEHSLPAWQRGP